MAEWSIAAVLKTVEGHTSGGSNPLSANKPSKTAVTQKSYGGFLFLCHTKKHIIKEGKEMGSYIFVI